MSRTKPDPFRHKKIKSVFIITLAITVTLAYNAFLIYHDRTQSRTETINNDEPLKELPLFSMSDVEANNSADNCWMIVNDYVYDVTDYVAQDMHPGGRNALLSGCGTDATASFERIHSPRAHQDLQNFKIGIVE